ncbi:MAG: hypothetical protein IKG52_11205 [Rhodobacteraceae bacterium]|nr:hypothetical protein [Paracoccaceae bacterium]
MIDDARIDRSMLILVTDAHWRAARWWVRIAAVICGKHHLVDHLGCRNRIAVWCGVPYLWSIREVSA